MSADTALSLEHCLASLRRITQGLSPHNALHDALHAILAELAENMPFSRPHILVQDPENGCLRLSLSYNEPHAPEASYAPGKGITGQVFAGKKPIIVPCMKTHPDFRNRLFERGEEELAHLAFICVPVCAEGSGNCEIIGTLSADTAITDGDSLKECCDFLCAVACMAGRQVAWLQEEMIFRHFSHREQSRLNCTAPFSEIVCASKSMRLAMRQIEQVAASRATVLLRGDSGVGKELMAAALHKASPRRDKPFVKLNCAALPAELIEGELFGWRKGAFTGALQNRKGVFEQADGGTLFLDEIGDLSLTAQAKVLRTLQEQEVQALGSERTVRVDVRLVCATNRSLEQMVGAGQFREDLYYRINVFLVFIPPLRERRDDILPLVNHYLEYFCKEYNRPLCTISPSAVDLLLSHPWPGNIRELRNTIERAVLITEDNVIRPYNLPSFLQEAGHPLSVPGSSSRGFTEQVEQMEKRLLADALMCVGGNIHQAARDLGITYRVAYYKIKKYNLECRHRGCPAGK